VQNVTKMCKMFSSSKRRHLLANSLVFFAALIASSQGKRQRIKINKVCHGFRLTKRDDYFWVDFDHFWIERYFWRQLGQYIEYWLEPKTKPPSGNLAWNALYNISLLIIIVITLSQTKSDNINWMKTMTRDFYIKTFCKWVILKYDHIKCLIKLTSDYIKRLSPYQQKNLKF